MCFDITGFSLPSFGGKADIDVPKADIDIPSVDIPSASLDAGVSGDADLDAG